MRREIETNWGMGLRTSRMGLAPSLGATPPQHRRRAPKRSFSSFLICGASSSTHEMEDYPTELLVNSAELGGGNTLKYKGNSSGLSLGSRAALVHINTENRVLSGRCLTANENPAPETSPVNVGPGDDMKCLDESSELVPCQSMVISRENDTASTSYMNQPFPDHVHATEIVNLDGVRDINSTLNEDSFQIVEASSNSNSLPSHGHTDSLFDEISVENNITETINFSGSEYGFSSDVSGSPIEFHLMRDDSLQEVIPSAIGFQVPEREQNRQEMSLIQGDLMGVSSGTLSSNSSEWSFQDARRNGQRLFWDAFSRRSPGRDSVSRGLFSSDESDFLRSQDRLLLDLNSDFITDEREGDIRSRGSIIESSNEPRWSSRSEMLERFHDGLGSTDLRAADCPRRIHTDGSCSCRSTLPTEESGSHAISRIVLLAQALFEVLDHMQRLPMSVSRPVGSLPAPESVIDSFPVKVHRKEDISECAQDVSQCYICLADYEEGDKIRVLPCHHEYHMSCVDKWLQEFHGVCPLCRGDVCQGLADTSLSNQEILSH